MITQTTELKLQAEAKVRKAYRTCVECGIVDKFVEHESLTEDWKARAIDNLTEREKKVNAFLFIAALVDILALELTPNGVKEYVLNNDVRKFDISSEYKELKRRLGNLALVHFAMALAKFKEISEASDVHIRRR
jgi:hypothetical protein